MIKLKTPAMLLCFDDCHIGEWHNYIKFFDDHNMKVTFYVSEIAGIRLIDHGWDKLHELQAHGHTIAYHGMNHLRAGQIIGEEGCEAFMAREIWTGLRILKEEGFDNIQHYCYPYGNRTETSDRCLWKIFRTLRRGGRPFYFSIEQIRRERLIGTKHFGKGIDGVDDGYKRLIKGAIQSNSVICGYMHYPMPRRLEMLASFKQLHFLPISVLDIPGGAG